MPSTNKGKTDPQLHVDGDDDGLLFPGSAEPDDSPTVISKTIPIADAKAKLQSEPNIDLPANRGGDALLHNMRGQRLAHFELIEAIGVGGMAAVLCARDTQLDRHVALKILPPEMAADPENVRRFHQEAKAAARLDHENIARVFFCGEDQGLHFIAFEFVEGDNLRTLLERRGRLTVAEAVRCILQVATGLEHAASRGVVHRDVKPSNIIISANGRAKLVDMGLARNIERHEADLTQSGVTLGTFDYISPEQALEPRDADARSDIYSLGCTFYHALTGQPPVPEGTAAKKLHHHQHVAPLDPRQLNPDVPDEIAAILGRMMHKEPRARYQRPIQLVQHLMQVARQVGVADDLPEGVLFVDTPIATRPQQTPLLMVAVPFLALAVLIALLALYPNDRPTPSPTIVPAQVRNPVDENKSPPATKIDTAPPVASVAVPGEDRAVRDAKTLDAVSRDASFKQRQTITLDGELRLADVKGLALHAEPGQHLVVTSPDNEAPANLLFDSSEDQSIGLSVQGGTIEFQRLNFKISAKTNWLQATSLLAVRGGTRVVFRKCVFEQSVRPTNPERPGISSVLIASTRDGGFAPKVEFDQCTFGSEIGTSSPGQVAVALQGPAEVSALNCAFKAHTAYFQFRAGCDATRTSVSCQHVSGFVVNGSVFRFDAHTSARLQVTQSVFSRNDPNAIEADLIHQVDPLSDKSTIRFVGEGNRYHHLNALWSDGSSFNTKRDEFLTCLDALRNGSRDTDSQVLAQDVNPWINAPDTECKLAFQVKPEFAAFGLQVGHWGPLARPLASTRKDYDNLKDNEKLFDPDARGHKQVFSNFERALASLDDGDTLLIKPGKDGRPIEVPPRTLRTGVNIVLKAFGNTAPVLTLGKAIEKKDLAFFRLLEGKIKLEGLHFLLEPRQDAPGPQSVLLLGDDGSAQFERCVLTLRGPRRTAAIALVNPNELMTPTDPPRPMSSSVEFKSCLIRGDGDLLALSSCRPLNLRLENSLVAVAGSLLALQGTAQELPADQGPRLVLERVSAFGQKPLFSLLCSAKNGKGLAQTTVDARACLFAPMGEKPSLIYLEAADVSEEQLGKYLQWVGKNNAFAKFDRMVELERPNEMNNGMPIDPQRWGKLIGEERAGKGDFTFPMPAETPLAQATPELLRPLETDGLVGGCGPLTELEPLLKALPPR